jgi:hypothetical protein
MENYSSTSLIDFGLIKFVSNGTATGEARANGRAESNPAAVPVGTSQFIANSQATRVSGLSNTHETQRTLFPFTGWSAK